MSLDDDEDQRERLPKLFGDYTFDRFVASPGNEDALKAAKTLAGQHGTADFPFQPNILFLHGGAGLGKTHMLVAIAHDILKRRPGGRVRYRTMEEFRGELLPAIRKKDLTNLVQSYSVLDVLLLDNVDELRHLERTQDEVRKILDLMANHGKAVALASALPLQDMPGLRIGLSSQLFSGYVFKLQPLDWKGRSTLIRNRLAMLTGRDHPAITEEAIEFLASLEVADIRELIGRLNRILFLFDAVRTPLTIELMVRALVQHE
jgi:chromosomal replication initiator protein